MEDFSKMGKMDEFQSSLMDPKIEAMANKVQHETNITDGDRTRAWAVKAVRLLTRTTKKYQCFDAFYDAVMREDPNTKCCSAHNDKLPGSIGRLNMFLLKVFRFPCLRYETQIKSIPYCRHQFEPRNRNVCLNPWHYRWVEIPRFPVPPIVVNKDLDYGEPPLRNEDPFEEEMKWEQKNMTDDEIVASLAIPNVTMKGDEIKILYDRHAAHGAYGDFVFPSYGGSMASLDAGASTSSNLSMASSLRSIFLPNNLQGTEEEPSYYRSGLSSPASDIASPAEFIPNGNDSDSMNQEMMENSEMEEETKSESETMEHNGNGTRQRPVYSDGRPITPIEPRPLFRSSPSELGELARNAGTFECVEYEENPRWLQLMYYEESQMVGDVTSFEGHHCLIDGFSSTEMTSSSRFSIGFYNNPSRSPSTSEVRSLIGKGVRLYLLAGEVYVENLCNIPVFVQSISANMKNGFQLNTVSKLPPGGTMKVFDMRQFSKQLAAAAEKTYQDVYCLSRMCTVRLSFCKGWGEHYRRSTVLRSPVWFQVHLNNPMAWIDSVLTCMGAPPRLCSSRT